METETLAPPVEQKKAFDIYRQIDLEEEEDEEPTDEEIFQKQRAAL